MIVVAALILKVGDVLVQVLTGLACSVDAENRSLREGSTP
jgi:hypothetical protein